MPFIAQFTELKDLNLEDNYIEFLPQNLADMLPSVENLNLNGNSFDDEKFEEIIDSLVTMRNLKSLFINLHEED